MQQDEIRRDAATNAKVRIQIAAQEGGSPEIAWDDTFRFALDENGLPRKRPFATIAIEDYDGLDTASQLNRGGLYRVKLDVGEDQFAELFGFAPRELEARQREFDVAAIDRLLPHPAYGASGWVSVVNPGEQSRGSFTAWLDGAIERASART